MDRRDADEGRDPLRRVSVDPLDRLSTQRVADQCKVIPFQAVGDFQHVRRNLRVGVRAVEILAVAVAAIVHERPRLLFGVDQVREAAPACCIDEPARQRHDSGGTAADKNW